MEKFTEVEFVENPEARCPCILLLDISGSMSGSPIDELNAGLQAFQQALSQDTLAMQRIEIAIITFGPVSVQQEFITAGKFTPPKLSASGDTPMGSAINTALDKIQDRKQVYKNNGIQYYRPWVFLITDGSPTDGSAIWQTVKERIQDLESKKKIAFFSVGVAGADMSKLAELSTTRQPLSLNGLNFRDMFVWLSTSLTSVSHSTPADEVPLQSPMGWGTV